MVYEVTGYTYWKKENGRDIAKEIAQAKYSNAGTRIFEHFFSAQVLLWVMMANSTLR